MFKVKNKIYWPSSLLVKISIAIVILSGFTVESAKSISDLLLPGTLILVFGYLAMVGTCRDEGN